MTTRIDPNWLAGMLTNPTIRGIAMDIAALIREERIAIGSQLPSGRELAQVLGGSPATISAAWSQLWRQKVIAGRGRTGMCIRLSICPLPDHRIELVAEAVSQIFR